MARTKEINPTVLRKKRGENQTVFWGRVCTTQSGGARYEGGRDIPRPVRALLTLAYADPAQAIKALAAIRGESPADLLAHPNVAKLAGISL